MEQLCWISEIYIYSNLIYFPVKFNDNKVHCLTEKYPVVITYLSSVYLCVCIYIAEYIDNDFYFLRTSVSTKIQYWSGSSWIVKEGAAKWYFYQLPGTTPFTQMISSIHSVFLKLFLSPFKLASSCFIGPAMWILHRRSGVFHTHQVKLLWNFHQSKQRYLQCYNQFLLKRSMVCTRWKASLIISRTGRQRVVSYHSTGLTAERCVFM